MKQQEKSIHNYTQRLITYRRNIQQLHNGQVALCFLDHLGALGLSAARVSKYASHIPPLLRLITTDLKSITKSDIETVIAAINNGPFKEWTKHDKKLTLRKLVQYAKKGSCAKKTPLPSEVSWIDLCVKEKDPRVTPEKLLTSEDFNALIKATENRRDRAMTYVLFEAALRPGELLTMRVSGVEFKADYCLISANGKTGIKRIPLVVSSRPLLDWLSEHPFRDTPNAPLWCALDRCSFGQRLSYGHFHRILKHLAKRAGLRKDVWPYLYRHTSLTAMAKVFTECRLEQFAGWTYGSKMTRRYVHFSARDLEDAMLELHGLKTSQKDTGIIKMVTCQRCNTQNPIGTIRCTTCGMIIDKQTALELEEKQTKKDTDLQQRLDKLEAYIKAQIQQQPPQQPHPHPLNQPQTAQQAFSTHQSPSK